MSGLQRNSFRCLRQSRAHGNIPWALTIKSLRRCPCRPFHPVTYRTLSTPRALNPRSQAKHFVTDRKDCSLTIRKPFTSSVPRTIFIQTQDTPNTDVREHHALCYDGANLRRLSSFYRTSVFFPKISRPHFSNISMQDLPSRLHTHQHWLRNFWV